MNLKSAKYTGTEQQKLIGRNIALIFEKASTRTRCAFEVAAHDQGANGGSQAGGNKHGTEVHAGGGENAGINHDDVSHRQEGGKARNHLFTNGGAMGLELE